MPHEDQLSRSADPFRNQHIPAGRIAMNGEVAADLHQYRGAMTSGQHKGGEVGQVSLGARAQVQRGTGRNGQQVGLPIQNHVVPTRLWRKRVNRIARIRDGADVPVVADASHGQADCRIHHAAGDGGRVQGGPDELDE